MIRVRFVPRHLIAKADDRVEGGLRIILERERERERERSLFAISLITSHITKSINGRLPERKKKFYHSWPPMIITTRNN